MFFKPKAVEPQPNSEEMEPVIDQEFQLISTVTEDDYQAPDEDIHELDENDLRDSTYHDEEEISQEDADEEERRHAAHQIKKKNDKIFNNSYNMGDGPEQEYNGKGIKLSQSHNESHLHDPERYRDHLDFQIVQRDIYNVIEASPEIIKIVSSEPNKKKYSKQEINLIFSILKRKLYGGKNHSVFVSPIFILEAISSLTMLEYRKLFDMLEYEYKEDLLEELDQKYGILENNTFRTKRLF